MVTVDTPTELIPATGAGVTLDVRTADRARELIAEATPANTLRAREGVLRYFRRWAAVALEAEESYPVPAEFAIRFVTDHLRGLDAAPDEQLVAEGVKARFGARGRRSPWARGRTAPRPSRHG